jgi:hypothetical protein
MTPISRLRMPHSCTCKPQCFLVQLGRTLLCMDIRACTEQGRGKIRVVHRSSDGHRIWQGQPHLTEQLLSSDRPEHCEPETLAGCEGGPIAVGFVRSPELLQTALVCSQRIQPAHLSIVGVPCCMQPHDYPTPAAARSPAPMALARCCDPDTAPSNLPIPCNHMLPCITGT